MNLKEPLDFEKQVDKLIEHNIIIQDREFSCEF